MLDHPLVFIPLMGVVLYVSGFLHEVGHALVGRVCGYTPTSLGMGTGHPFLVFGWKGIRVYLARARPLQGLAFLVHPAIIPDRRSAALTMGGGIFANALLCGLFLALADLLPVGENLWRGSAALNGLLATINLVPMAVRVGSTILRSDGAQILLFLRDGLVEVSPPARVQNVAMLRPLWTEIGDRLGLYGNLTAAALAWSELNDHPRAEQCLRDAESLPIDRTPFVEAYSALIRAALARRAWRLEEAQEAAERSRAGFEALGHPMGKLLLELAHGELLLAQGYAAEAAAHLDRLTCEKELVSRPGLAATLATSRLCAHLEAGHGAPEDLYRHWEGLRRRQHSPMRELAVYRCLGRAAMRDGNPAEAANHYGSALAVLRSLYEELLGVEGEEQFAGNQIELLREAETAYLAAGRDPAATGPQSLFPPAEILREQTLQTLQARNQRRHRIGLGVSVANLFLGPVIFVVTAVISLSEPRSGDGQPVPPVLFLGVLLTLYGAFSLLRALYLQIAVRWAPTIRTQGGNQTLFLAFLPWITWLVTLPWIGRR